jgi:L-aminopeptidase/D-esterase-like protein
MISAASGSERESKGNVGGGAGMVCFEFKGGIGTASRNLVERQGGYIVGALVQSNFGLRHQLTMQPSGLARLAMLPNDRMNPLFDATAQAVEEAIINALVAAETMVGRDGHKVVALPHDGMREILKRYNRLIEPRE